MSVHNLKFIESYFATTEEEAENFVVEIKESQGYNVVAHSITKKVKKDNEYYIVKITKEYNQEKDLV